MAHPAHYFLRYLVVTQDDLSEQSINSTLVLHGLAPVADGEIAEARQEMEPPEGFRLWDARHAPSKKWLRNKQVYSLVHPDETTREVRDVLLASPRLRERLDTLILGGVPPSEIALRLQKSAIKVSANAVSEYRHYFWNPTNMGLADWAHYFLRDKDDDGSGRTTPSRSTLKAVLHGGADMARYKAGLEQEINGKKILLELQQELYFTFREIRTLPLSDKKVAMLSAVARGLSRLDERLQAGDQALQDTLRRFEQFKMTTDTSKVPSLAQLAPKGTISSKGQLEIALSKGEDG